MYNFPDNAPWVLDSGTTQNVDASLHGQANIPLNLQAMHHLPATVHAWATWRESFNDKVQVGDNFACKENGNGRAYTAQISQKNSDPDLGQAIWGDRKWRYVFILRHVQQRHFTKAHANAQFGYQETENWQQPRRRSVQEDA